MKHPLIDPSKIKFDGLVYYNLLDLRSKDKHLYVYNKILEDESLIEYCFKHCDFLYELSKKKNPNVCPYFSKETNWSWYHILRNKDLLKKVILEDTDYSIQMRHCSGFMARELFSEEERLSFLAKWRPVLRAFSERPH